MLWTVIASLWQWGVVATPWLAVLLPLTWVAVPLVVTDLHHRRLPRVLTVALGVLALPLLSVPALVEGWPLLANAVLGGAFTWALHAAAHRLSPASLGRGDVLLAAPTGAVQAASGPHALLLGTLLASVITVLLHLARRRPGHWRSGIPHAPGVLAATTLVTLLHAPLA
ncbi:hypothetical protein BJP25_25185 [Actinokineospora bangkokensis]|uniref:Prepilin type IV endopeptidase peptidase domain-containing protein n=1 Tax=Actinokineospora bangkokensis TaxID=1193682 RepID=A0A1Q9LI67_9PSEU|nr:hypothetical protein BJP25_25185 [Actinokineospora bangkokensis]